MTGSSRTSCLVPFGCFEASSLATDLTAVATFAAAFKGTIASTTASEVT